MKEKDVSVEKLGVASGESIAEQKPESLTSTKSELPAPISNGDKALAETTAIEGAHEELSGVTTTTTSQAADALKGNTAMAGGDADQPPDRGNSVPLHPDLATASSRRTTVVTALALAPAALFGFVFAGFFGFPLLIGLLLAAAFCAGWLAYRSKQKSWYHYATCVFNTGKILECEVDLVSSGELDRPYVMVKQENQLTRLCDCFVFKVVAGKPEILLSDAKLAGRRLSFLATCVYDKQANGDAVIFEVAGHRLWCKPFRSRGM